PQFPGLCWECERSDSQGGQTGEKEDKQYIQHFVYVVPTFGKKKGSDASS
ncbi:hypothetical protein DBR06_SOUSAS1810009, partial [Sousa chinensis]